MTQTKIRKPYQQHEPSQIEFLDVSLTKQSHKKECDINHIMQKFQKTGLCNHINTHEANYGEATSEDFYSAMQIVANAQSMFAELPSSIRNRFSNNPASFLDFVQDPKNSSELVSMGLAHPPEAIPTLTEKVSKGDHPDLPDPLPEPTSAPKPPEGNKTSNS